MRRFPAFIPVLAMLLVFGAASPASAQTVSSLSDTDIKNMVLRAANHGDFATLEALAEEHRSKKTRFPNGDWLLATYYSTFELLIGGPRAVANMEQWTKTWEAWRAAYPKSPTPIIAQSRAHMELAWHFRGTAAGRDVWAEDMKKFHAELRKGKELLEKNRSFASADPAWYQTMAIFYRGLGLPLGELLEMIKEGTAREPLYYPTYTAVMRYLTPQWGGSAKKMQAWAKIAIEQTEALEGEAIYARYYVNLVENREHELIRNSGVDMLLLKRAAKSLLEQYPIGNYGHVASLSCWLTDADWVKETHAAFAEVAKDPKLAIIDPNGYCGWAVRPVPRKPWAAGAPGVLPPPSGLGKPEPQKIVASPSDAEADRLASAILEQTYMRDGLVHIKEVVRQSLTQQLMPIAAADARLPKLAEAWQSAVTSAFDVEAAMFNVHSALKKSLTVDELTEVNKTVETPLLKKFLAAEKPKSPGEPSPAEDPVRRQAILDEVQNAADGRYQPVWETMLYSGSLRMGIDNSVNLAFGNSMALHLLAPAGQESASPEEIYKGLTGYRTNIEDELKYMVVAIHAQAYAAMPVNEIKEYSKAMQAPVMQKFVDAVANAMNEAMLAQMYAVGLQSRKNYTGDAG